MSVREILQARIEERSLSLQKLSGEMGRGRTYLYDFLTKRSPEKLEEDDRRWLAKRLDLDENLLREPNEFNPQKMSFRNLSKERVTRPGQHVTNVKGAELLEVRGMAEGGPDGWNLWNGEVVQVINRPDNLIGVKGAYGVLVRGTSMMPRYDPNMIAHVHPWMEVTAGECVVVQRRPIQEGDPPMAVLKRLVRRSGSKVILEQLNPPQRFEVPASEVISIHLVVGSSRA